MCQKARRPALAKALLTSTPFFVCYSCPLGKSLIFVSIVVGITSVGCIGSSNELNPVRVVCCKVRPPTLAEAMLPSTHVLCVWAKARLRDALECVCSHSMNNFSLQAPLLICTLCTRDKFQVCSLVRCPMFYVSRLCLCLLSIMHPLRFSPKANYFLFAQTSAYQEECDGVDSIILYI